ncbi:MAG: dipicolinate synthase subunit B [Lachnospiraceae bacterium]|nr:dipicolinate synthase subunit B [Lachnospiraceae bacterium]
MELSGKNVGLALTGSFCTYEKAFQTLEGLKDAGANLYPILSDAAQQISSRFGTPKDYLRRITAITGRDPILSIETAEPLGPSSFLDVLAIVPCTGNTAAKLSNGITDGPVLMAAKAHLRTGKPLVIAISTNDGLGMNLKNIGLLYNSKSIYFVPFGQDNWVKKPNSLVARLDLLKPTLEHALEHKQYQPVLISYPAAPSRKES